MTLNGPHVVFEILSNNATNANKKSKKIETLSWKSKDKSPVPTVEGWTDDGELCKTSCEKSGEDYNWCYKFSGSWDRCTPEIGVESTESSIEEEPMYEKKLLAIPNNGANRRWGFDAGIKPRYMGQKVSNL